MEKQLCLNNNHITSQINRMKLITTLVFALLSTITFAQNINNKTMEQRLTAIEDKMAIKYVVDEFSNLADTKEIDKQVLLFTEDGTVTSISNGQPSTPLKGRGQLKQAFSGFAEAVSYCRVILVGKQNDKEMKTTLYTIYKDVFIKAGGKWLIKERTSNFVHREVDEVKPTK
jgi:hypothetical protein